MAFPTAIPEQAAAAAASLHARLGANLVAICLYGSCVDGGLQPRSDLDLLVVLRHPLADAERAALMQALLALSAPPGAIAMRALEVTCVVREAIEPWRHPAMRELQFGEWLRDDLLAVRVSGRAPDPDLALLLAQARSKGIALHGPAPADVLPDIPAADIRTAISQMLPGLAANLQGEENHALLTLARMWVTLRSGAIVSKTAAGAAVLQHLPPPHRPVLQRACDIYLGLLDDDWTGWQERVARCVDWFVDTLTAALHAGRPG